MLNGGEHRFRDMIASAIGWWADAGVGPLVDEQPRDWLAPIATRATPQQVPAVIGSPATNPAQTPLPDTLDGLRALLAEGAYAPQPAPPSRRIAPAGQPGAVLMIVADMPEPDDAGSLFTGEAARLFDAMLAAMGQDRTRIYLAPFSPARAAGRIDGAQGEALAALMRRHIALAAPGALMLLGDEPARWLIGAHALEKRGGLRVINHDGGTVPAIAIAHPRLLRRMPALKAGAWADMRLLIGVLAS